MRIVDFEVRKECPPQLCDCERERLLADAQANLAILRLNLTEEKRLLAHIDTISTLEGLRKLEKNLQKNLGVVLRIAPGVNEVKSVRGIVVAIDAQPGVCKKIRQSIPAAIRRTLEAHPQIMYAILDANDLFGAP